MADVPSNSGSPNVESLNNESSCYASISYSSADDFAVDKAPANGVPGDDDSPKDSGFSEASVDGVD